MFIKSAIAMLVTIGFAGGAVYYGTSGPAPASTEVELRAPEKITPQKQDKDLVITDAAAPAKVAIVETPHPDKKPSEPQSRSSEPEQKSVVVPGSDPIPELEPEPVADEDAETVAEQLSEPEVGLNLSEIMPLIMRQIDKMTNVETKDQAYYDVVEFSVRQGQYNFADAAMQNIDQTVLRDTARSQIAVALALNGRADDAFEVIDAVETEPLRDAMRLQVIEALIVPEKLPRGLGHR